MNNMRKYCHFVFGVLSLLLLTSCGILMDVESNSKVYSAVRHCYLKDGLWGSWYGSYAHTYVQHTNSETIIYLYGSTHPSNFDFKITIQNKTVKVQSNGWTEYQGTIQIADVPLTDTAYLELNDAGRWISCTIKADQTMTAALSKGGLRGVLNILYGNGKGRGFSFHKSSLD